MRDKPNLTGTKRKSQKPTQRDSLFPSLFSFLLNGRKRFVGGAIEVNYGSGKRNSRDSLHKLCKDREGMPNWEKWKRKRGEQSGKSRIKSPNLVEVLP